MTLELVGEATAAPLGWLPSRGLAGLVRVVPVVAFVLFVAIALGLIATTEFPAPDELEHLSYAASLQESGRWMPRFEAQKTLNRGDFRTWDDRANYMGHPSPYYIYESWFLDRSLPPGLAAIGPRLGSLALLCVGVGLALWVGARCFGRDPAALVVFSGVLALCPQLLTASQQVTNDGLAVLGGGLAYWGGHQARWRAAVAAGAGLMLALWAKANAGLGVGLFLGFAILVAGPARWRLLAGAVAGGLLGLIPAGWIYLHYGAVVPVTAESFVDCGTLGSFAEYWPAFLVNIGRTWGFRQIGDWPIDPARLWLTSGMFWAMVLCCVPGIWLAARRRMVSLAGPLAFLALLPVHLWFSAFDLGFSLPAASFRYDLALLPGLAHGLGFSVLSTRGRLRLVIVAVVFSAVLSGWLL